MQIQYFRHMEKPFKQNLHGGSSKIYENETVTLTAKILAKNQRKIEIHYSVLIR